MRCRAVQGQQCAPCREANEAMAIAEEALLFRAGPLVARGAAAVPVTNVGILDWCSCPVLHGHDADCGCAVCAAILSRFELRGSNKG